MSLVEGAAGLARGRAYFGERVSGASVAFFRRVFGLVVAASALRTLALGWVEPHYLDPTIHFAHAGFSWLPVGPAWLVYGRYVGLALAGLALAFGRASRTAAALIALLFAWNHLVDKALYLNHHHLVMLFAILLAGIPATRTRPSPRGSVGGTVSRGSLWLLRAQVMLVYLHAGLAKIHPDWLLEAQPLRLWFAERDHWPLVGGFLAQPATASVAAVAALLFDLGVPFALLFRPTRSMAFVAVIVFHLATALLFPIGVFPWLMTAAATLLLAPDWCAARASGHDVIGVGAERRDRPVARWAFAAGILWVVVQVAWPLRSHLVTGDPLWHERGFRFAWRVMLMEKQGTARFVVREGKGATLGGARRETVDPAAMLTPIQCRMMATQPDMILDFARHLAARYRARGWRDVEVRVESWVSLNAQPAAPLIDPDLDLAAIDPGPLDRDWILPRPSRSLSAED